MTWASTDHDVVGIPAPLPPATALNFGRCHALAILDQAMRGLPRSLPWWLVASALLPLDRTKPTGADADAGITSHAARDRLTAAPLIARDAIAMQALWSLGYAAFSGARTAVRLARFDRERVLPLELRTPRGQTLARASAYRAPLGNQWHVEGVFAWPRSVGGGSAILARLLADADSRGMAMVLTCLSPRVARVYERAGFRKIAWIYWMRRTPQGAGGGQGPASTDAVEASDGS